MKPQLLPATELATKARNPFPGASPAYEAARQTLLAEEIEFCRHMCSLNEQCRALPPGPVITKGYRFNDEQVFDVGLKDLFGDKDTLGTVNGNAADIKRHVALKILDRSSVERQFAFAQERGWRDLNVVQTMSDDDANDLGLLKAGGSLNAARRSRARKG